LSISTLHTPPQNPLLAAHLEAAAVRIQELIVDAFMVTSLCVLKATADDHIEILITIHFPAASLLIHRLEPLNLHALV
jgi:hypothetical protein